jgi:hypothetical protein
MAGVWDLAPAVGRQRSVWDLAPALGGTPTPPKRVQDIGDAVFYGLQNTATGLAFRRELPEQEMGADAPWQQRIAAGAAGMLLDMPLSIIAAVPAAPTGPIGMGAAAFAAPMALREALIEAYSNNHATTWEGVWEIAKAALTGGTKGAIIGGATMGAGRFVGAALPATTGTVTRTAAATGAELTTLTTTAAALEGRMPTWQEFMDNAILLGGMKGAVKIAGGLRSIYAETGKTPAEVLVEARKDPAIKVALEKQEVPEAYRQLAVEERVNAALDVTKRQDLVLEMVRQAESPDSPLLKDPVRYEYITDAETAQGLVRATAEVYRTEVEAQRRGAVPTADSLAEGIRMVETGEMQGRTIGAAANSSEIAARALLAKGAAEHARKLAEQMPTDPAAWSPEMKLQMTAALERTSLFYGELAGVGAEAGRALQMLRQIKRNPEMMGDAEALVKLYERKGSFTDIATIVRQLKDPEQVRRFAEELQKATTTEKFIEGWKAAILSGPLTHLANMMGNSIKWAVEVPESMLTASLTATQRKLAGDPLTLSQYKAKAFAPLIGLQLGARDALKVADAVMRSDTLSLDKADVYRTAIPGKAGEVIRTPFRALQAADALFRIPGERGKAYELAVDRVVKEGLHPETREAQLKIAAYVDQPTLGLNAKRAAETTALIDQAGAEAVFTQRLGPRLEGMQRAMAGHWSQFVIPFVRTPANLVSWAVQHTPALNLMSGRWRADFAAGGEARNRAIARVAIGTGLAATAFAMAEEGLLTGGGLFEPEMSRTKRGAGWQPYSIKVGDKYYSYQRMEPVSKVLGLAADGIDLLNSKKLDAADTGKMASMLVLMFGNATVSTTYLSGLANTMNAVLDPDRYGEQLVEGYASSLVPKIIGQSVTLADPYQREVTGALDAIQSQLPFIREKLLPKRDAWGEPVENNRWFNVMPVATTKEATEKVKTEAVRLQIAIADAPKAVFERGPFKPSDKKVELSDVERDIFRQVAGGSALELLRPIVNAPDWARTPDFAKARVYQVVLENTRKQAQWAALPPDAPGREKIRRKIIDLVTQQTEAVN